MNKAPTFVREGEQVKDFNHPYFLTFDNQGWCLRDGQFFENSQLDKGTWMRLFTEGWF